METVQNVLKCDVLAQERLYGPDGAVLVTDNTGYLPGRYDENDMVIFDLEHLEELPGKIKNVLGDEEKRCRMAESGREKTRREHTWDKRAEQFLELLDNR